MPYARKYKKRTRHSRRRSNKPSRGLAPMPLRYCTKLRFHKQFLLTNSATAGNVSTQLFSANGVFDPDLTSGATQPRGFDQLMALYKQCYVIGAKIHCTCTPSGSTSIPGFISGITLADDDSIPTTLNDALESRLTKYKHVVSTAATSGIASLVMKSSTKKFNAVNSIIGNDAYASTTSANPTNNINFVVFQASDISTSIGSDTCHWNAVIDYLVVFTDPIRPAQS